MQYKVLMKSPMNKNLGVRQVKRSTQSMACHGSSTLREGAQGDVQEDIHSRAQHIRLNKARRIPPRDGGDKRISTSQNGKCAISNIKTCPN